MLQADFFIYACVLLIVSETDENDAEISEAEVKTDSEIKTEEENTSTYNTGYAQWVEDDDDEE